MESNHRFGDLHHCRLVGCGLANPRSAIELYSGNITPTRLRHPVGKHPRWCRCKEINSSFHTLPLMISGKTTLTSFGLRSWIVNLSLAYPASRWIFCFVYQYVKELFSFHRCGRWWNRTICSDQTLYSELHHRFRLFPSVNIHCFRSLFKKPAGLADGWK